MPTAAKLICALLMMGVGYATSQVVIAVTFPDGIRVGLFPYWSAFLGFFFGWRVLGRMVGEKVTISMMNGLFAGGMLLLFALISQAFWEMIQESLDLKYNAPEKAFNDMLRIAARMFQDNVYNVTVLGFHFGMSMIVGLIGHGAAKRWR